MLLVVVKSEVKIGCYTFIPGQLLTVVQSHPYIQALIDNGLVAVQDQTGDVTPDAFRSTWDFDKTGLVQVPC